MIDLEEQIKDLKSDLKKLAEKFEAAFQETTEGEFDSIRQGALKNKFRTAVESSRKAGQTVQHYAQDKPWQIAGLALAAGFLAGMALTHRSKSE